MQQTPVQPAPESPAGSGMVWQWQLAAWSGVANTLTDRHITEVESTCGRTVQVGELEKKIADPHHSRALE
jgi:hypothetical protein